jgi:O-methyltransferase
MIGSLELLTLGGVELNDHCKTSGRADCEALATENRGRYLELLKMTLTRARFLEQYRTLAPGTHARVMLDRLARTVLSPHHLELVRRVDPDAEARELGLDWPAEAETMIGLRRLDHLQQCIETIVTESIPGDVIETGIWRGGAVIFMRAALDAWGESSRLVWAADSFAGLPVPNGAAYPVDKGDRHHTRDSLRVPLDEVRRNFAKYGLSEDGVRFLKGWFKDTLPRAPIERLALLRMDGDMYESTMDALTSLHPKVAAGGFVVVDDYSLIGARAAVADYREQNGIEDAIIDVDGTAAFWRRPR